MEQCFLIIFFTSFLMLILPQSTLGQSSVTIREAEEVIPAYLIGPPDPNPMFYFGKSSQGAEGRIYPYPLYDNHTNKKSDKIYHLIYMVNEYIKISLLPEIGGRLFSAFDRINNYDFVYHQHVIKPSLISLIGTLISGGIEWTIPYYHQESTFLPVQWSIEERPDSSKTVWFDKLEVRQRMLWAIGYTLRPGSSVLECFLRIINRTDMENTMLCFANIAVGSNDNYQVIYTPSIQWSTGHRKRSFQPWPVNNDVDASWYKNNKSSASWFAMNHEYDFVAGYDHGKKTGIMSVANHNIVQGKKFFTWCVGSNCDKIITDNQPDYLWLQPYEERSFELSWYPFRGIDGVKKANLDAAVNFEIKKDSATFGFYTTKAYSNAKVILKGG